MVPPFRFTTPFAPTITPLPLMRWTDPLAVSVPSIIDTSDPVTRLSVAPLPTLCWHPRGSFVAAAGSDAMADVAPGARSVERIRNILDPCDVVALERIIP